jgi:hypothetical protein
LVAGSLAFGLEALLIGFGGRLIVIYREKPWLTVGLATGIGLSVVGISIVLGFILVLEPLYVCFLLLLFTLAAGRLVAILKPKLVKPSPTPPPISDAEIGLELRKRGFKRLLRKKKR